MGRFVATVRTVLKSMNFVGLPESISGVPAIPMPPAKWLVIEPGNSGVYLFRYDDNKEEAGDTWHPNETEAREQADFEFGLKGADWIAVPDSLEDPIEFAKTRPWGA